MLKDQIITNTWKCDSCAVEEVSDINPFFRVTIQIAALPNTTACDIDLCQTCIAVLTPQQVIDYVSSAISIP